MSRERASKDPFYAVAISKMQSGVRGIVREFHELFKRSKIDDVMWLGSGWRTGSVEHKSGTAIDIIFSKDVGVRPTAKERETALKFLEWLIKHHKILGIEGILISRDGKARTEVWGYSTPGRGWRQLANRGSIPANHIDHLHVKFFRTASWPSVLNGSVVGDGNRVPTTPGLPSSGVNPKSIAQMATEVINGKHGNGHTKRQQSLGVSAAVYAQVRAEVNKRLGTVAYTPPKSPPPFPVGLRPNRSTPSAIPLQRKLKEAGFMPKSVKEHSNYGPQTQKAVVAFHNKHTQFKSKGVRNDPAIGPKGWKFLFERW